MRASLRALAQEAGEAAWQQWGTLGKEIGARPTWANVLQVAGLAVALGAGIQKVLLSSLEDKQQLLLNQRQDMAALQKEMAAQQKEMSLKQDKQDQQLIKQDQLLKLIAAKLDIDASQL